MNPVIGRFVGVALLLAVFAASGALELPDVEGTWLSGDGDGWIEITHVGDGLSGIIKGSPNAGDDRPDRDVKNPDPALRDRLLTGLELFRGFSYDGDGRWTGGTIYDPNSGKTYRCIITWVDKDTLKVRGYIGVPMLGRTETWRRVPD
ncbi:MAG: hypothetical protein AMS22_01920 [Thiotrichales bacterium SG8_50]|nr:MAG: hypothetical protein AMS22_01920 [Thiotrichales bacterium SG8_50]